MSKEGKLDESRLIARNLARELTAEEADFVTAAANGNKVIAMASTTSCCSSDNQSCDLDWDDTQAGGGGSNDPQS